MRGNNHNEQYNYIELLKQKQVTQHLTYFPEHKERFDIWFAEIKKMTLKLQSCYWRKFVLREITNQDIPYELRPLVFELHGLHLKSERKQVIDIDFVINYFNQLPTKKMIFVLNYEKNKEYHESKKITGAMTAEMIEAAIAKDAVEETEASIQMKDVIQPEHITP